MRQSSKRAVICAALACVIVIHTGFVSNAAAVRYIAPEIEKAEKAETAVTGQAYAQGFQKAAALLTEKQEEARRAQEEQQQQAQEEAQTEENNSSGVVSTDVTAVSGDDAELLAALIFCEAGGEPYEGQVAVGAVVMNRVKSASFPNSISEVIYQSGQFGPAITGKLSRVMAAGRTTDSCYQAAQEALAGNSPVGDAVYFGDGQDFGQLIGGHWFHS